ncbi:hypothetical protein [Cellulomonas sp. NPDC058312]|uniref:hypothetical protein n=1 Tax=Cellulomonas sp. NPDC058312 TaxID=3346441 RepID=UPI0036EB6D77
MLGMRVNTDKLRSVADRLDAVSADLEGPTTAAVLSHTADYGDAALQSAARAFLDSWTVGLRFARESPAELAAGVRENACTYDEIDASVAESFRRLEQYDPVLIDEPLG